MTKTKLILALDVENLSSAKNYLSKFKGVIEYYKIGSTLFTLEGPKAVELARKYGGKVFLDLKYHDIPNTVKNAVSNAYKIGVYSVSLHISGGKAMIEECSKLEQKPLLWGISALTSLDEKAYAELGFKRKIKNSMIHLSKIGAAEGLDGLVCSGKEIISLKKIFGGKIKLIVPGIKTSNEKNDQKRTVSPMEAAKAGADFIVVGRAILNSKNPLKIAEGILRDLK